MTATPVDVEQRVRTAVEITRRELRCDCWWPEVAEFGAPCLRCQLLAALGEEDE